MQTVEAFIHNRPRDEQEILRRLRELIFRVAPHINEGLLYGLPYFSRHRRIVFLSPASAVTIEGVGPALLVPKVTVGFCYGHLIYSDQRLMPNKGHTDVYTVPISSVPDIHEDTLSGLLNEAILIDARFSKKIH